MKKKRNKIVVSLGGSLLFKDNRFDAVQAKKLCNIISRHKNVVGIVVGGGVKARQYANAVRHMGKNEFFADLAAIRATHENAKRVARLLGRKAVFSKSFPAKPLNKIVVMGGTVPGITTDADACLLAECLGARSVVNLSKVKGIFDRDPRKHRKARQFKRLSHAQLTSIAFKADERKAGTHFPFDLIACKLAARSKLALHFVDGRDLKQVERALARKKYNGTIVKN